MLRWKRTRLLGVAVAALGIGAMVTVPSSPSASANSGIRVFGHVPSTIVYDRGVHSSVSNAEVARATVTSTVAHFSAKVVDGTSTFTYTMVGKNPSKTPTPPATGRTTVTALLVPVAITYSNGHVWDPTVADACDSGASVFTRVEQSPIFVPQAWKWGGISIGTKQLMDAFQRAEFWKYTKPTGVNPTYGVGLTLKTTAPVVVNVPDASATEWSSIPCANGTVAGVDINWLDPYLQSTVMPSLTTQGLMTAKTLPIFIFHNVYEYDGTPANCCIGGFHGAYSPTPGVVQTYIVANYENDPNTVPQNSDIVALSHEVGEWLNDPYGNNPTKPWGHIGQVSGCQGNLEVGDPLSGTGLPDTVGGFTYHPQELAFFSWFYHQSPSIGLKGWYSNLGTFKTSAAPCS
jgi:hypothetical protein